MDLPNGVQHLVGALHLIPFDIIQLPEASDNQEGYSFSNPRLSTKAGQRGFSDPEKMASMRESIRTKTLLQPLICRWVDKNGVMFPQLVGGNRRYASLEYLISNKEMVKDPSTAKFNPETNLYDYEFRSADLVYGKIACQVFAAQDDISALSLAHHENAVREDLPDGHDIAVVIELQRAGATEEQILSVVGRQAKWLRDTNKLIESLDDKTMQALLEGEIIREGAVRLAKIEDLNERHLVLEAAIIDSKTDEKVRIDRIGKRVRSAMDQQEIAEGDLVEAEYSGDDEAILAAKKKLEEASMAVQRTTDELQNARPIVKNKNVRNAMTKVNGKSSQNKCLREPKIKKFYAEPLRRLIEEDGKCEINEGEKDCKTITVDLNAVSLALKLVEGILSGEKNLSTLIAEICENNPSIASQAIEEAIADAGAASTAICQAAEALDSISDSSEEEDDDYEYEYREEYEEFEEYEDDPIDEEMIDRYEFEDEDA